MENQEVRELLRDPESNPPAPEFWDEKTNVLFCLDNELGQIIKNFNRQNRAEVLADIGLTDAQHVDEYSPELWSLTPEEFWRRYIEEYTDGDIDPEELAYLEEGLQWSNQQYTLRDAIGGYRGLWNQLANEQIPAQLVGSIDIVATNRLMHKLSDDPRDEEYISRFILPNTFLLDEPDGNLVSGKNTSISLEAVEEYDRPVPKRTVIVTDTPDIVAEAKNKGYSVIGVGRYVKADTGLPESPDFWVAHPFDIQVNHLETDYDNYQGPEKPNLLEADGTTDFWIKAFWDQVAHVPKDARGWGEKVIEKLGFEDAIVRSTVVTAIRSNAVTGEHANKLSPLALTLLAYDGTPYSSDGQRYNEHETLIDRFQALYGSKELDTFEREATNGTHLYEDNQGRVFLSVDHEDRLNTMAAGSKKLLSVGKAVSPKLLEVMDAYGIDYIVTKYSGSGEGYTIDREGVVSKIATLTEKELQKQMIDQMVERMAHKYGIYDFQDPELWNMFVEECWAHWDNDKPINVEELAKSLGELATPFDSED
jgi:hypothetical protein